MLPIFKLEHPYLKYHYRKIKWIGFSLFLILFIIVFPKRNPDINDELKNIFINERGERISQPLIPYLTNIVPEVEILKSATLVAKLPIGILNIIPITYQEHIREFHDVCNAAGENVFLREYRDMYTLNLNVGHNTPFQLLKSWDFYKSTHQFYLKVPKDYEKKIPLIVFMHGLLGNWQLYYTYLSNIKGCAVACIGTDNLSGKFYTGDLQRFKDFYLPIIKNEANIDDGNIHLVGLSNGGSGVTAALNYMPGFFKSYVFVSTEILSQQKAPGKVFYIGGDIGPGGRKYLPSGVTGKIIKGADHMVILTHKNEVLGYLQNNIIFRNR